MYSRVLQLAKIIKKQSIFLMGPRQTGKSTLIKQQLIDAPIYSLLDTSTYRRLSADPGLLRREVRAAKTTPKIVVIDEVQLLPDLLNEVHLLIEEFKISFVLTGSSARALKRKGVNLLGGRAHMQYLHPLVSHELGDDFDLDKALQVGTLPSIYSSDDPQRDLEAYIGFYLKEEIAAEGLARNMPSFSRFLEVAALANGKIMNFTNIASDAEVKRTTVIDWFQILKDTMIAHELPAWTKSKSRKAITSSKFYLFDVGVARYLTGQKIIERNNPWYGIALETFIFHELRAFVDYRLGETLEYWRSITGQEVDFILDQRLAIEVKASTKFKEIDAKGLLALSEEKKDLRLMIVYCGESRQKWNNIDIVPVRDFLDDLWSDI